MNKSIAVFLSSMVVGTAIPLTSQALYREEGATLHEAASNASVELRRPYTLKERADYRKAQEIYRSLLEMGQTDLVQPNLSKPDTISVYLDAYPNGLRFQKQLSKDPLSTKDYVKPAEVAPSRELSDLERLQVRTAAKTGSCPLSLPRGLRELCKDLLKTSKPARVRGLRNDLIQSRQIRRK